MSVEPQLAVIVVAAGSGTRLKADRPKAFVQLGGRTILAHALHSVFGMKREAQVIVVAPEELQGEARTISDGVAGAASDYVTVVAGGDTRQRSVAAALAVVAASVEVVLVHDAARALTPAAQFDAVVDAVLATQGGVIPGLAVTDTIKRVDAAASVTETVDRSELRAVQTPQGFPRRELDLAYAVASNDETDDAAVFVAAGYTVVVAPGDEIAFKITTPWDLRRAEGLLESAPAAGIRTGIGLDVHAYDDDVELWLAGLLWPGEPGLAGHSDGDAVCHAMTDALLSAAGLGDIGSVFGTADPRFENARGELFLRATRERVEDAGFGIVNVAVQLMGNRPRFSHRRSEAEAVLSSVLGAPVSIAATTTDSLGFTGRGEGVCAIATAIVTASAQ